MTIADPKAVSVVTNAIAWVLEPKTEDDVAAGIASIDSEQVERYRDAAERAVQHLDAFRSALVPGGEHADVYAALVAVKAEVDPVSKDRLADPAQGGYKFRGIEAVLGAIQRVMARHGLVTIPHDRRIDRTAWTHYRGDGWYFYRVKVRWEIRHAPSGTTLYVKTTGEAIDNGDKGLGKARSYAQKDLWIRILELPTDDPAHGDTEATTPGDRRANDDEGPIASVAAVAQLLERLTAVLAETDGRYPSAWREVRGLKVERLQEAAVEGGLVVDAAFADRMRVALDKIEEEIEARRAGASDDGPKSSSGEVTPEPETGPDRCELCGSARTKLADVEGVWRCRDPKGCARRISEQDPEGTHGDDEEMRPAPGIVCASCGETLPADQVTYGDDEQPYHAHHNPTL